MSIEYSDLQVIMILWSSIRRREKEETLTFHEWLTLYDNNFDQLRADIRKTESYLRGISY